MNADLEPTPPHKTEPDATDALAHEIAYEAACATIKHNVTALPKTRNDPNPPIYDLRQLSTTYHDDAASIAQRMDKIGRAVRYLDAVNALTRPLPLNSPHLVRIAQQEGVTDYV